MELSCCGKRQKPEVKSLAVTGAQWGDEGKGKIVDYLASRAHVVARFQGGNNAGHTVMIGSETFKMHHLPVGLLYPGVVCILGNGMVINPPVLVEELEGIQSRGWDTSELYISDRAHVILPFHLVLDQMEEKYRADKKIGTTGLGIGPAYADKACRRGLRMIDLVKPERFKAWLEEALPLQNNYLQQVYGHPGISLSDILNRFLPLGEQLSSRVTDTSLMLNGYLKEGYRVLFEGSQGGFLDLDHGTYPYVTSSSTTAGGACSGLGIGPHMIREILGVIKAYTTRVGEGPFPTEELGETGERMRHKGAEYGTTTGRPRRCGWFDAVMGRYSARLNGYTGWAVTKLDVLSGLEKIKIATAYYSNGNKTEHFPSLLEDIYRCEPIYEELPGWEMDIQGVQSPDQLPIEARQYLKAIEDLTGVAIDVVSTGPEREQVIVMRGELF